MSAVSWALRNLDVITPCIRQGQNLSTLASASTLCVHPLPRPHSLALCRVSGSSTSSWPSRAGRRPASRELSGLGICGLLSAADPSEPSSHELSGNPPDKVATPHDRRSPSDEGIQHHAARKGACACDRALGTSTCVPARTRARTQKCAGPSSPGTRTTSRPQCVRAPTYLRHSAKRPPGPVGASAAPRPVEAATPFCCRGSASRDPTLALVLARGPSTGWVAVDLDPRACDVEIEVTVICFFERYVPQCRTFPSKPALSLRDIQR